MGCFRPWQIQSRPNNTRRIAKVHWELVLGAAPGSLDRVWTNCGGVLRHDSENRSRQLHFQGRPEIGKTWQPQWHVAVIPWIWTLEGTYEYDPIDIGRVGQNLLSASDWRSPILVWIIRASNKIDRKAVPTTDTEDHGGRSQQGALIDFDLASIYRKNLGGRHLAQHHISQRNPTLQFRIHHFNGGTNDLRYAGD